MASEHVKEFTDQNFADEVMNSPVPVLVDFWAEWCGPCRALGPTIEKLAKDYAGRVKVGKMDVEANRDVPMQFRISNIPMVVVIKGGETLKTFIGLRGEKDFREALDAALAG
ncbi:MAG: thioredoxin [Tepidisphaeraceae bacterium]|jgi:thioredoxin 1